MYPIVLGTLYPSVFLGIVHPVTSGRQLNYPVPSQAPRFMPAWDHLAVRRLSAVNSGCLCDIDQGDPQIVGMAHQFYIWWFGNLLVSFTSGFGFLATTYVWSRCLFQCNYYDLFALIYNLEYDRPFGSYFIVSVVYCLFWSTMTFLKNSILRFASPRRELVEELNESP